MPALLSDILRLFPGAMVWAVASGLLALACIRWLGPRGWMDHPDERKSHPQPVPSVGGLVVWAVLVVAQAGGWLNLPLHRTDWIAIHVMALVGALDDRLNLRARWKALAGLVVAAVLAGHTTQFLLARGEHLLFFGLDVTHRLSVVFPLLLLWFWGLPQAFNLIDGLNGLTLGFSLLLLGFLGFGTEALPLFGALAALLLLNFPRARHFIGDTGALLLGTLFATLAMVKAPAAYAQMPLWLLAYPILDTTRVVLIRTWEQRPLAVADRRHLHHWMLDRFGGRVWLATPTLLVLAALPMFKAVPFKHSGLVAGVGLGLLALVMAATVNEQTPSGMPSNEEALSPERTGKSLPLTH